MDTNDFGGGFVWIFGLLILLGMFNGGFGYGGGGAQQYATRDQVQNGFDTQNMMGQTRDILTAVNAGTAQSVAATNQVYHDVVGYLGDKYNELARDISGVALQNAQAIANQNECCCSIKQLVMQNNYDSALRDAATNANFTAQVQSVKDLINENKIEALQAQVNKLQLDAATANVLRYPNSWTYAAGVFPPAATTP
jgi:hypothetical protein